VRVPFRRLTTVAAAVAFACLVVPAHAQPGAAAPSTTSAPQGMPDGVPPAALRAEPTLPIPSGWSFPDRFPRTSGTGRYAQGAFEWTDYLYDDHGAFGATVRPPVTGLAPPRGTYVYPAGAAHNNGADLFRIGVAIDGNSSVWRVDWTTLDNPDLPIVAFAVDADGNTATGASSWGAGSGLTSNGIDHVLVISSRGAWVTDVVTQRTTSIGATAVTVDHDPTRAMGSFVARVPASALPALTGRWTIRAASGLASADGRNFAPVPATNGALPGQPAVYDLGFDPLANEPAAQNSWMENTQAQALATGNAGAFAAVVDWGALSRGANTPEPLVAGPSNRWYVSAIEVGKGVVPDASAAQDLRPNFLGRVQPYAVYVPRGYNPATPTPLTWMLHSLGVQHNQYISINPKFVQQACEARGSICATTLGRGPDGWYYDEAELDFWQVWHSLATTYRLDPDRTVLSGYSMGGWATYKLGLSYPDLFAKAVVVAGPQVCGIRIEGTIAGYGGPGPCTDEGRTAPLLGNATNLPYYIAQGGVDELVPASGALEQARGMMALGLRVRFELFPTQDHLAWAASDLFASPAANMNQLSRTRSPHAVSLTWYPALVRADYGIGTSGAYWVRAVGARQSGPGVTAQVDATSDAIPSTRVGLVKTQGPVVTTDTPPLLGAYQQQAWQTGPPASPTARVDMRLVNVGSATLQLARAGLRAGEPGTVTLQTDGATALTLANLAPNAAVKIGARVVARANAAGVAVIGLNAGRTTLAF
jgi:predicted esterase